MSGQPTKHEIERLTDAEILRQRLQNQHISQAKFEKPENVVEWLGAVQAQDYGAAKWAVGQRTKNMLDSAVEQAFADGAILRTHVMRPTWHFVTPADIRWLLTLTAPRVHAASAYYYRKLELDDALFAQSNHILTKALEGGKQMTRNELGAILEQAGISTTDLRLTHMMFHAELDGVLCSGARRGKQHTYALLEERVPSTRPLAPDEALAELTLRYFTSHGPATLKDYSWWSGLTIADVKAGVEMAKSQLFNQVVEDETYWFAESQAYSNAATAANDSAPTVYLLPNYDEYVVAYSERSAMVDTAHNKKLDSRGNFLFNNTIVIDGRIAGTWQRSFSKNSVTIEPTLFAPLSGAEARSLASASQRYAQFLGLSLA